MQIDTAEVNIILLLGDHQTPVSRQFAYGPQQRCGLPRFKELAPAWAREGATRSRLGKIGVYFGVGFSSGINDSPLNTGMTRQCGCVPGHHILKHLVVALIPQIRSRTQYGHILDWKCVRLSFPEPPSLLSPAPACSRFHAIRFRSS